MTDDDILVMLSALTDIPGYLATHPLSPAQFKAIADFDGDNKLTNRDIQGMLDEVASIDAGGSGSGSQNRRAAPLSRQRIRMPQFLRRARRYNGWCGRNCGC